MLLRARLVCSGHGTMLGAAEGRAHLSERYTAGQRHLPYGQFFAFLYPACWASASLVNVMMFAALMVSKPGQPER